MQNGARFFAYSTWSLMISLAIIIFTHQFIRYMEQSITITAVILIGFGALYVNLAFAAIKRFIKKVPAPTNLHYLLGGVILLPPLFWIWLTAEPFTESELLMILILIISIATGVFYGNRAGIKARYEYVQKLKEYQKRAEENKG